MFRWMDGWLVSGGERKRIPRKLLIFEYGKNIYFLYTLYGSKCYLFQNKIIPKIEFE